MTEKGNLKENPVYQAMTSQKGRMLINGFDEKAAEALEERLALAAKVSQEYGYAPTPELPGATPTESRISLGIGLHHRDENRREEWRWLSTLGYETVQVGMNTEDIDQHLADRGREFKELRKEFGMRVTAGFLIGNLSNPNKRLKVALWAHARKDVLLMEELGAPIFVCHAGEASPPLQPEQVWREFIPEFAEFVDYAEKHNVKVAVEAGYHKSIMAIVNNVPQYRRMFKLIPSKNLGISLDVSHFIWMMIDVIHFIKLFPGKLFQIQAKDGEILWDVLREYGIHDMMDMIWWRYRIPGFGVTDWAKLLSTARDNGYNLDTFHVEAEDPVFSHRDAVARAARYLLPIIKTAA